MEIKAQGDERFYFHVGYGKTATSWLQEIIFSKHEEINYLGKYKSEFPKWILEWSYLDDFMFEEKKGLIKNQLTSLLINEKANLISSESFLRMGSMVNQAKRIKAIAPKSKIIIVLRNPIEIIKSFYKYNVM
nr:sulfotransferase domain-containing protein [Desulfobacula sp.]